MPPARRGRLVVLEGIDGAGKSTQIDALARHYEAKGMDVTRLREPGDSAAGRELRELTKTGRPDPKREHDLFLADRREDVAKRILPALDAGHLILLDRYYVSNMAYQGARGLDPERIRADNEAFAPRPDLVVVLDVPVDDALARTSGRGARDGFEERANLTAVRDLYLRFAATLDWVTRVEAARPPDAVTHDLVGLVDAVLDGR